MQTSLFDHSTDVPEIRVNVVTQTYAFFSLLLYIIITVKAFQAKGQPFVPLFTEGLGEGGSRRRIETYRKI